MKAKFIIEIEVTDPDSGGLVQIEIWKHENGAMFGIDSSYLEQVSNKICDPFSDNIIKLKTP